MKKKDLINNLKVKAKELKKDVYAICIAYKHPKTPWYAKVLAAIIVCYALSPLDLIPDFIPVLGYLDDLIIVPAGIALLIKIIPKDVMEECRKSEIDEENLKKKGIYAAIVIILFWTWIFLKIIKLLWR